MNRAVFEISRADAAGRLGTLTVPRAGVTIETPALLPVVNAHIQDIPPAELASTFGAEIIITNAYSLHGSDDLRGTALERGLHELLDFPGAIMTDSGSFQLSEYGDISVDTPEILAFQQAIGSDIATPVDIPTPPDADRERANAELAETKAAIETTAAFEPGEMLLSAPIQGGRYPELRAEAARHAYEHGFDVYPVGAMVPLLRDYRYADIVDLVAGAKQGLGVDAPVHLFGAGHPMMFALGVAMGCDLFDSAAYALYAREDRYLTVTGTASLTDLRWFPCDCPVCTATTPSELREMGARHRQRRLAEHNLYVSFAELRRVKQAIIQGELLELLETRARSHPTMLDGYRAALDHWEHLERTDPATANRPVFYLSTESARRPEVIRHHQRLERLPVPASLTLVDPATRAAAELLSPWERTIAGTDARADEKVWHLIPPFGPVPPALIETYPLTAELPARRDQASYRQAIAGVNRLFEASSTAITVVHHDWPAAIVSDLAAGITVQTASDREQGP